MVNVNKANFLEQSNVFIEHVHQSSFISIDLEMSGISTSKKRPCKDESPSERYSIIREPSERYSIVQLGICLFQQKNQQQSEASTTTKNNDNTNDKASFIVRRFNFTLFPSTDWKCIRDVVINPSSIQFLQQHQFDVNDWCQNGIPFCTVSQLQSILPSFLDKTQEQTATITNTTSTSLSSSNNNNNNNRIVLSRTEDKEFVARAMADIREWIDSAITMNNDIHNNNNDNNNNNNNVEGVSLLLPPCNSFLRRALYEAISREYPSLVLETTTNNNNLPNGHSQIRLWRLNATERRLRQERLQREAWESAWTQQLGMIRIFIALSNAAKGTQPNLHYYNSHGNETSLSDTAKLHAMCVAPTVQQAMAIRNNKATSTSTTNNDNNTMASLKQDHGPIPIVVHNGLQDLLFLMTHFVSPTLPETWSECKSLIHEYFPVIYDTKCMATYYCPTSSYNDNNNNNNNQRDNSNNSRPTTLSALFNRTVTTQDYLNGAFVSNDTQGINDGNNNQANNDDTQQGNRQEHEASYDAYMTGAAFCGLSYIIQQHYNLRNDNGSRYTLWNDATTNNDNINLDHAKSKFGRNQLYLHLSINTIDLEHSFDPLSRDYNLQTMYRVSNIDPGTKTHHIRSYLATATATSTHSNNDFSIEIIWINDTTFIVAVKPNKYHHVNTNNNDDSLSSSDRLLLRYGQVIRNCLARRFPVVMSLQEEFHAPKIVQQEQQGIKLEDDDTNSMQQQQQEHLVGTREKKRSIWNLWGILERNNNTNSGGNDNNSLKRRRLG